MAEFLMPSLGADMEEGTLVAWRIQPGDKVRRGQIVAEVDTAKGVIEIECFLEGVVEQLLAAEGVTVPVGMPLARIATPEEVEPGTPRSPSAQPKPVQPKAAPPEAIPSSPAQATRQKVAPRARKRAEELQVELTRMQGTGADGEITVADVERAAEFPAPPPTQQATVSTAADDNHGPTRLRRAIAAAMARSKREIPHYYLQTTIDMARATAWLTAENQSRPLARRLLPAVVYLKGLARALRDVPQLNGFWIDNQFVPSSAVHIGFAISMRGGGLVAPAVHDADSKSLDALMADLQDLIPRARRGPLRSSEMTDSTITLTSLGDLGVDAVWGVIYPPQVAIVGLGRTQLRPWVADGELVVRPVLTATLAADHRASDGMVGAKFLEVLQRQFQQPEEL